MKHYVILSGIIGGIIGSVLTALLVSPVTAQRDKFGAIECRSLTVVDEACIARIILTTDYHDIHNPGIVKIVGSKFGGSSVQLYDSFASTDAIPTVHLGNDTIGGFVCVNGNDFYHRAELPDDMAIPAMAKISVGLKGGLIKINNKHALSKLELSSDNKGLYFADKGNMSSVQIGAHEGDGFVFTKDKNGQLKVLD